MKHSAKFLQLVNESKSKIRETNIDEVKAKLEREDNFCLVDVREESEWNQGHLPGAIHIGKGIIERDIETIINNTDTEIILYCGGGFRSALAADNLQKMGYTKVSSMDGGYRGWIDAGYPTEPE